jgi:hypothetical protein
LEAAEEHVHRSGSVEAVHIHKCTCEAPSCQLGS